MDNSFSESIADQLQGVPELRLLRMFGGTGLFSGQTFFGIVYDGRFYLKTDDSTRTRFTEAGMSCLRPSEKQALRTY